MTRPVSDISEFITCQRGSADVSLPTFEKGEQVTRSLSDISEWIEINGQGRKGHVSLLVTFRGAQVCLLRQIQVQKHYNCIESTSKYNTFLKS